MTRVHNAARIAEIIRRQADALRDPAGANARRPSGPAAGARADGAAGTDLGAVVARRVRAISVDDPERRSKVFRVFMESVLLAELGDALINDPAFYQLVDQVLGQMRSDAALAQAMDESADLLLSRHA